MGAEKPVGSPNIRAALSQSSARIRKAVSSARENREVRRYSQRLRLAIVSGTLAALTLLPLLPEVIVRLPATKRAVEAELSVLLRMPVTIASLVPDYPLGFHAAGVRAGPAGKEQLVTPSMVATPRLQRFITGAVRFQSIRFLSPRMSPRALGAILAIAAAPADRVPDALTVENGSGAIRFRGVESPLTGLALVLQVHDSGERRFRVVGRQGEAAWTVDGDLKPAGRGALQLEARASSKGVVPLDFARLPGGPYELDGALNFRAHAQVVARTLENLYVTMELDWAELRNKSGTRRYTLTDLELAHDSDDTSLKRATLQVGDTVISLHGAIPSVGETRLSLQCDRFGVGSFPAGPAIGEAGFRVKADLEGPWSSPKISAELELVSPPAGGGVKRFKARLQSRLNPSKLKLHPFDLKGELNGAPLGARGAVTIPPWEPTDLILALSLDLPSLQGSLLGGTFLSALPLLEGASLSYKGSIRGRLKEPELNGRLRIERPSSEPRGWLAALITSRHDPKLKGQRVEVKDASLRTGGRGWFSRSAFEMSLTEAGLRFETSASFRGPRGATRRFRAGKTWPVGASR